MSVYSADSGMMSFGRYLKVIREKQGISLETVASEICVSPRQLSWIEAEDHARMPNEVYTKGILRSYAKVVGVDPQDIIERYRIHLDAYEQTLRAETEILTSGKRSIPRMLIALGVLGAIIAASLYAFNLMSTGAPEMGPAGVHMDGGTSQGETGQTEKRTATVDGELRSGTLPAPSHSAVSENLLLVIDAVSEVTLNVQVDSQAYTKYQLDPNDHVELEAESNFNILISDAAGVRLQFNGEPVRIDGEPGHSVNILLPNDIGSR